MKKIIINFQKISPKERKNLREFLKRFMSVQIIDESESKMVLKSFKIEELSIEECLKRLYFLSASMLEEIGNKDKTILKEMRDNMTRFYYMLVMQIRRFLDEGKFTRENQISLIRAMDFRMVAEKIQRIGEAASDLGNSKNRIDPDLLNKISKTYEKVFFCFLNESYKKAPGVWENVENLSKKVIKLEKNENLKTIINYMKEISGLIR